ncbi:GNAT family N-acetyltransferase [Streptococcus catagoni]|uniref:GNAT family N-acetyltransferase n=1 Tax=Streptococcus catagoni TaxID=2654874 RepID=UPI001409A72A|nr:GNAT family protein [Streptococcus catagoni]
MMKIVGKYDNNLLPTLETDRLILRQRTLSDAEDIFAFASLGQVTYQAGFPPVPTVEEEINYLQTIYPANLEKEGLPSGYGIALKDDNKIIGSIDFNHKRADDVYEIGYLLHPDFWGQAYMLEAARALIEYGFTELHLHKIEVGCFSYNKQSQRVAEKLGFSLEGRIRDRKDPLGRRTDDLRYGLLRSEWESKK